jgi:hypothetical protein
MNTRTRAAALLVTATSAAALGIGIAVAPSASADLCNSSPHPSGNCTCNWPLVVTVGADGSRGCFFNIGDPNAPPPPAPMPSPLPKPNPFDRDDRVPNYMPGHDQFVDKCRQDPQICGQLENVPRN